ncbi:MAG: rod shape-determining protein MreD [Flavobacteriia bacterium]|nr:rod shape-determining protein MreD [Flavobacteriia bacterium]
MMSENLRWIGRFVFLVLFQVFILNNIQLAGYLNPYLYVLFILSLPTNISRSNLLFVAFALGFTIDIFENSGGAHTSATLTLAFLRPFIIRFVMPATEQNMGRVNLWTMGTGRFFTYSTLGVLIHHLWFFSLEAFRVSELIPILSRTLVSAPITLLLIYITQLFVYREE